MPPEQYEELLDQVFLACHQVMRDGARIAVVMPFGVGRNPWRPLGLLTATRLQKAGFILRGQIVWDKGSSGNRTSWGSFRSPSDPSLRDTVECILVAHKAHSAAPVPRAVLRQDDKGTHSPWLASSDYFLELAQDHWIGRAGERAAHRPSRALPCGTGASAAAFLRVAGLHLARSLRRVGHGGRGRGAVGMPGACRRHRPGLL
ncbi:MAG: hypothetical protein V9H69_18320 [Anaerolineae bacterium]